MKKLVSIFLTLIIVFGTCITPLAMQKTDIDQAVSSAATYIYKTVADPIVSSVGGEWAVLGLARSNAHIDSKYFEKYHANVQSYVQSKDGILHSRKYTEYSRVVIALTAIGKNPEDVAGYNLVESLLDYDKTIWQGINGPVWALIALDCGNYGTMEIRERYIARILECEKANGGWALSDSQQNAEVDITAMALIALSRYKDRQDVREAIDRAINLLSDMQNESGGYLAYNKQASESTAQVLTALSALQISYKDARFVKNGKTLIDNIYSFRQKDGSFSHTDKTNLMATEQCLYALVAAQRLEKGKTPLFDMRDVPKISNTGVGLFGKDADVKASEIKFPGKTFSDIAGHKNQTAIEKLAERGIINGMSENSFAPDRVVTRAEFAAITVRALGLPMVNKTYKFADVNDLDWYAQYVNATYSYGIINGVSETEFNPNGEITIEQASAMVERAAKLCGKENLLDGIAIKNVLAGFTDYMTVSQWAKPSVAFCLENDILDKGEIEIKPLAAAKRCQIAQMLYNMLKGARLI